MPERPAVGAVEEGLLIVLILGWLGLLVFVWRCVRSPRGQTRRGSAFYANGVRGSSRGCSGLERWDGLGDPAMRANGRRTAGEATHPRAPAQCRGAATLRLGYVSSTGHGFTWATRARGGTRKGRDGGIHACAVPPPCASPPYRVAVEAARTLCSTESPALLLQEWRTSWLTAGPKQAGDAGRGDAAARARSPGR